MSEKAMAENGAKALSFLWEAWRRGGVLDTAAIQAFMLKEGFANAVPYDPAVHGRSFEGAEMLKPGDTYFVATDLGWAMLSAARPPAANAAPQKRNCPRCRKPATDERMMTCAHPSCPLPLPAA